MPLYENKSDRKGQAGVQEVFEKHLDNMIVVGRGLDGESYFECVETPDEEKRERDLDIYHHGRWVGVAEIKCRTYRLDAMKKNGVLMGKNQMTKLRMKHWSMGRHVIFLTQAPEGVVLMCSMADLMHNPKLMRKAPEGSIKDDHGKIDTDKEGVIIDFSAWEDIGSCDIG
jgi:hypothetical protein